MLTDTVPLLQWLNGRAFQKLPGSRSSVFAQIDAPALMALPVQPWEWAVFKTVRVHIDSHVEFEGHCYSVPNALVGLALELRVTAHAVSFAFNTTPKAKAAIFSAVDEAYSFLEPTEI